MSVALVSVVIAPGGDLPQVRAPENPCCGVGLRIGMIHGDGTCKPTLERALNAFAGDAVDVIPFGHSPSPYCKLHGYVWSRKRTPDRSPGSRAAVSDLRVNQGAS